MPRTTAVAVGDGACTILRCERMPLRCGHGVAVLDCGVWQGSAKTAAETLIAALGSDIERLDALIVSHFDADHWEGLKYLAHALPDPGSKRPMTLYYAGLPFGAEELPDVGVAQLLTLQGSGVRAVELQQALRVARPELRVKELFRHAEVQVANRKFGIFWPPECLDLATGASITASIEETWSVAEALVEEGHPELFNNLRAAYGSSFAGEELLQRRDVSRRPSMPDGVSDATSQERPHLGQQHQQGQGSERWEETNQPGGDGRSAEDQNEAPEDDMFGLHGIAAHLPMQDVSADLKKRFRKLCAATGRANNDLSLIMGERNSHFAAFGDAHPDILRAALRAMNTEYEVVLAPHHGTYDLPDAFPSAGVCISQAGSRHYARWDKHVHSHGQERSCVSTYRIGTLSIW